MVAEIDQAHKDGDTLGGVVEVVAYGLPPGLGSHVHWDRRLDLQARGQGALMGIQAIKGVEVGDGFDLARGPGSAARRDGGHRRRHPPVSGRFGGTEGGAYDRRTAPGARRDEADRHGYRVLRTVDVATGEPAVAHHQRSDVCAVRSGPESWRRQWSPLCARGVALEKFGATPSPRRAATGMATSPR